MKFLCYGSKPGRHFARNLREFAVARSEELEVNQWIVLCFQNKDSLNFYHFLKLTVGKPEVITNWLFSKQRTHELTIVFLWFILFTISFWWDFNGFFVRFFFSKCSNICGNVSMIDSSSSHFNPFVWNCYLIKLISCLKGTQSAMRPRWPGHLTFVSLKRGIPQPHRKK